MKINSFRKCWNNRSGTNKKIQRFKTIIPNHSSKFHKNQTNLTWLRLWLVHITSQSLISIYKNTQKSGKNFLEIFIRIKSYMYTIISFLSNILNKLKPWLSYQSKHSIVTKHFNINISSCLPIRNKSLFTKKK